MRSGLTAEALGNCVLRSHLFSEMISDSPSEPRIVQRTQATTLTALHAIDAPVHKTGVESSAPGANVPRDIIIRAEQCDPRPQGCRCRSKSTFFQGIH